MDESSRRKVMGKPRIFLGSSGKQEKLLQALVRGLGDIVDVEPWTTSFNPGVSTLERLIELTREVDFAVFIFAADDFMIGGTLSAGADAGQMAPRDNVVFEAGLFGGVLGMRRTFILHAHGAKLPTDLLGLTAVRYDADLSPAGMRAINQKLKAAIEEVARPVRIEGAWWQYSLTARTDQDPSALGLLQIGRDRFGALEMNGRSWDADGRLAARYRSKATNERDGSSGIFYYWEGERPLAADAPRIEGTGEISLESDDRASGYFTVRSEGNPPALARTSGIYWRADPDDLTVLDGRDDQKRAALIAARLKEWESYRDG
jgi:hypothetical protein